jgi:uncharacterized protein
MIGFYTATMQFSIMEVVRTSDLTYVFREYDKRRCSIVVSNVTGAVAVVDEAGANLLRRLRSPHPVADFSEEERMFIKTFYENGFIVEADENERTLLEKKIEEAKNWPGLEVNPIVTYFCNLACTYCYVPATASACFIERKLVSRIAEYVKNRVDCENLQYVNLSLYGGEPLLKWSVCEDLITRFSDDLHDSGASFRVGLYTNGTLLTPAMIDFLESVNTHFVQVTLDGPREIHDRRRKFKDGQGTFDLIMENIGLIGEKLQLNIRVNVDKENLSKLPALIELLLENELNRKNVTVDLGRTSHISCSAGYKSTCISHEMYGEQIIKHYFDLEKAGFNVATPSYFVPLIRTPRYIPCISHSTRQIFVDPSGDLYTCAGLIGDRTFSVGNIWKSNAFDERISKWANFSPLQIAKCSKCKQIAFCGGGCAADAVAKYGSFEENRVCGYAEHFYVGAILPYKWYKRFLAIRKGKEINGSRYESREEKLRAFGTDFQ